jgi:hypothetical protein
MSRPAKNRLGGFKSGEERSKESLRDQKRRANIARIKHARWTNEEKRDRVRFATSDEVDEDFEGLKSLVHDEELAMRDLSPMDPDEIVASVFANPCGTEFSDLFKAMADNHELTASFMRFVRNRGAELVNNPVDMLRCTLLHHAAMVNNTGLCAFLVNEMGARTDVLDSSNNVPLALLFYTESKLKTADDLACAEFLLFNTNPATVEVSDIVDACRDAIIESDEEEEGLRAFYEGNLAAFYLSVTGEKIDALDSQAVVDEKIDFEEQFLRLAIANQGRRDGMAGPSPIPEMDDNRADVVLPLLEFGSSRAK